MATKLYEIEVLVRCVTVVAASSEEQALDAVKDWREGWRSANNADLIEVSEPEVVMVREPTTAALDDEAHVVVQKGNSDGEA